VLVSNCHWNNLTRVKEEDPKTGEIKRKIWVRSGDDHWALATTYWRVGMDRFGFTNGEIISSKSIKKKKAPYIINESMPAINPYERFKRRDDWRNL